MYIDRIYNWRNSLSPSHKQAQNTYYPAALTIAGSDSGGGAGIQADLRTFAATGVFGASAITALTAQNPFEVTGIHAVPADFVKAQLDAVLKHISFGAAKTGMLFNSEIIEVVAERMKKSGIILVTDPVMISTSGAALLKKEAAKTLMEKLLPVAKWVTPNIPEAEVISGIKIKNFSDMKKAALHCAEKFGNSFIVKGGHIDQNNGEMTDVAAHKGNLYAISSPAAETEGHEALHGTGCTFSAAFTACLAGGLDWQEAIKYAKAFVLGSLSEAAMIGKDLYAMYPPLEDYSSQISFKRL